MKKTIFIAAILLFMSQTIFAQLFNDGRTLRAKSFSIGINPAYHADAEEFGLFFHGGYGLGGGADLGIDLGFGWWDPYVGVNFEKSLSTSPFISLFGGGHIWGSNFGFDFGALATFAIRPIYLTTGLEMDVAFYKWDKDGDGDKELDTEFPFWLPVSIEFYLQKHVSLVFEAEIGLNDPAYTYVGGGVNIYF